MSASIDGLVSGLDTTSLINQLMSFERAPLTKLQTRQATFDAAAKAWDDIAAKVSVLRTAAEALDTSNEVSVSKATSSDPSCLTATAGTGAMCGSLALQIESLAVAHQRMSPGFPAPTATIGAGTAVIAAGLAALGATAVAASADFKAGAHTIAVTRSGSDILVSLDGGAGVVVSAGGPVILTGAQGTLTVTFASVPEAGTSKVSVVRTSATATLTDLATAISTAGGPATAQVLDLGAGAGTDPPARFVLTATQTGTAGELTVDLAGFTGLDNTTMSDLRPPADAVVHIGTLTATRSSNTISDLLSGVTLNLSKATPPGTDVTVTVGTDADAVVTKVKALVDGLNAVRTGITKYTSYNAENKLGGVLLSDATARTLSASLAQTTGQLLPEGAYRTLSSIGVTLTRDGTYKLDETKLRSGLGSDQSAAASSLASLAKSIATWAKDSDGTTGVASRAKASAVTIAKDYGKQIDNYQVILDQREARYRKQFSRLETVLGQLRDQSNWLAGQIATL